MEDGADISELDTCGLLCPLPVLKARKRLQSMAPGAALRVLADDRFVFMEPDGVRTLVRVNEVCMRDLPAAAARIMATRGEGS